MARTGLSPACAQVAGFVDFDWGAALCPSGSCPDLPVRRRGGAEAARPSRSCRAVRKLGSSIGAAALEQAEC